MALFKSREQRRFEREMQIKKGLSAIRRQIRNLRRQEKEFLKKAVKARQLLDTTQYNFLKGVIKKTAAQRRMMERQLLAIETALAIKSQAEAHMQFVKSLSAISRAISAAFNESDFERTEQEFEKAMMQAQTMEQRVEVFLEHSQDLMATTMDVEATDELISDEEIDQMVDEELARAEGADMDKEISKGLAEIEKELRGDREQ